MQPLRPATISSSFLASRLESSSVHSPFAEHLRRSEVPDRMNLDDLVAVQRDFHSRGATLNPDEVNALRVPRQGLEAQSIFSRQLPKNLGATASITPPP